MDKIRIGIIGLGMGKRHIAAFRNHPAAEVVAISDINPALLEQVRRECRIPSAYTDEAEMIARENLDVVAVATPNYLHKIHTITALEAGCHVFCEKPMAMNTAEAEEMLAASIRTGKRLGIDFRFRFAPQSVAMKQLVDSGRLGSIYYGRTEWLRRKRLPGFGGWFGKKAQSGGGALIDLGVHRLDLALWLMGYPEPEWVMGMTDRRIAAKLAEAEGKSFDVEDFACGFVRFKNGAALQVDASWTGHIRQLNQISTRVLGSDGGLCQYNIGDDYNFEVEYYTDIAGMHMDEKLHPPVPECHDACYTFIDCLVRDIPFTVNPREGVMVMKLLDALYRSAATGAPVRVE